jgi:endonuclease YncB( thermonuclease family)
MGVSIKNRPAGVLAGTAAVLAALAVLTTSCDTGEGAGVTVKAHTQQPQRQVSPSVEPATQEKPPKQPRPRNADKPEPKREARTYVVTRVVDGDTIELANGEAVRIVGIDTPEVGQCGYEQASNHMADLVLGKSVALRVSDEDADRYGRLLRYVDIPASQSGMGRVVDAGLNQIRSGFAIARYDSRDGYGFHPRENAYIAADRATKNYACAAPKPTPAQGSSGGGSCMSGYSPCLPVVPDLDCADINHPVQVTGSDPYRLDADGDGIGCDA